MKRIKEGYMIHYVSNRDGKDHYYGSNVGIFELKRNAKRIAERDHNIWPSRQFDVVKVGIYIEDEEE